MYWNDAGSLRTKAEIHYAPGPLESSTGDGSLGVSASYTNSDRAIIDIDGDGYLDILKPLDDDHVGVHFGYGNGEFTAQHYAWPRPNLVPLSSSCCGIQYQSEVQSLGTLLDINGDGLPDLIGGGKVYFNLGDRFDLNGVTLGATVSTSKIDNYGTLWNPVGQGMRYDTQRWLDVDGDGLLDVVDAHVNLSDPYNMFDPPEVRWNTGYPEPPAGVDVEPLYTEKISRPVRGDGHAWYIGADVVDLDSDGFSDIAQALPDTGYVDDDHVAMWTVPAGTQPPRLLTRIDHGNGRITTISYTRSTKVDANGNGVIQGSSPQPSWVVTSVTDDPGFGEPALTTTYQYLYPKFLKDDDGTYGFRGFGEVRVTRPSGSVAVSNYGYGVDWRGLLVEQRTYASHSELDNGRPFTIQRNYYNKRTLFGGLVRAWSKYDDWLARCEPGESDANCRAKSQRLYHRTYVAPYKTQDGTIVVWKPNAVLTMNEVVYPPAPGDDDDWQDVHQDQLFYSDTTYWLRPYIQRRRIIDPSTGRWGTNISQAVNVYDSSGRYLQYRKVWQAGDTVGYTKFTYDQATGNVLSVKKPVQRNQQGPNCGDDCRATTYGYDGFGLYRTRTTNELGHTVFTDHDLATGAVVRTRGPVGCTSSGCSAAAAEMDHTLDAFGRVLETRVRRVLASGQTELTLVGKTTYDDASRPQSVASEALVTFDTTDWTKTTRTLDGFGRQMQMTELTFTTPSEAVTRYSYDAAGNLVSVQVPDPSLRGVAGSVHYDYTYDNLGRPTSLRRPEFIDGGLASGIAITYPTSLGSVRHECIIFNTGGPCEYEGVDPASLPPATVLAETQLTTDVRGRLVEVAEKRDASNWSITQYAYSRSGNLETITDADGYETQLAHDWVGNRTAITRAGKTWQYRYDLNNNMIARIEPVPAGASQADYTTTIAYDDLDRITSHMPALRGMSPAEQAEYGTSIVVSLYDSAPNGTGQLARQEVHGFPKPVGGLGPVLLWDDYEYDLRGNLAADTRAFDLTPTGAPYADQRTVRRQYGPSGQETAASLPDGDAMTSTYVTTWYDRRGLPFDPRYRRPGRPGLLHTQYCRQRSALRQPLAWQPTCHARVRHPLRPAWPGDAGHCLVRHGWQPKWHPRHVRPKLPVRSHGRARRAPHQSGRCSSTQCCLHLRRPPSACICRRRQGLRRNVRLRPGGPVPRGPRLGLRRSPRRSPTRRRVSLQRRRSRSGHRAPRHRDRRCPRHLHL